MRCKVIDKRITWPIVGNRTPVRQITQCHELTKLQKLITHVTQLQFKVSKICCFISTISLKFNCGGIENNTPSLKEQGIHAMTKLG